MTTGKADGDLVSLGYTSSICDSWFEINPFFQNCLFHLFSDLVSCADTHQAPHPSQGLQGLDTESAQHWKGPQSASSTISFPISSWEKLPFSCSITGSEPFCSSFSGHSNSPCFFLLDVQSFYIPIPVY